MISSGHCGDSSECCTACGADVDEKAVYYFGKARVCAKCFADLNEGTARLALLAPGDVWHSLFCVACLMMGLVWGLFIAGCCV